MEMLYWSGWRMDPLYFILWFPLQHDIVIIVTTLKTEQHKIYHLDHL